MIRVLRIINRFNLGGPTYNATYLTAFLGDEFETMLIGGKPEKDEGDSGFIPEQYQVNYQIIDEMQREISLSADKKALSTIRKIIRDFKPHVVHTHASKAGFLGRMAAYKENVPVIVHTFHGHVFHSYFGSVKTMTFKKIERYLAKKTDAIIAISEIQKQELSEIHKIAAPDKFRVIPLGFDLDRFRVHHEKRRNDFRSKYNIRQDEVAVGIIGRLTAIKNHNLLLEATAHILKGNIKPFKIFVIGGGELMQQINEKAKEIESQFERSIFIFTSWIKEIDFALPGLDLVCLSSLNEGTPVSLIEAQAAGVPVLTTNVGGVRNVVDNEKTGIIVDSFDPELYGEALRHLINNEENRVKMSQNGWDFVRNKFHYQRLCEDVQTLYKELLRKKGIKT